MRLRWSAAGPIFQLPIPKLGRTGSGDLESVAGCFCDGRLAGREEATVYCPVSPGNFERLSHVAVNFQSLFVRTGELRRFCSPNEQ